MLFEEITFLKNVFNQLNSVIWIEQLKIANMGYKEQPWRQVVFGGIGLHNYLMIIKTMKKWVF